MIGPEALGKLVQEVIDAKVAADMAEMAFSDAEAVLGHATRRVNNAEHALAQRIAMEAGAAKPPPESPDNGYRAPG